MFSEKSVYEFQKKYMYPVVHITYVKQEEAVAEHLRGASYTCLVMVVVTVLVRVLNIVRTPSWTLPQT